MAQEIEEWDLTSKFPQFDVVSDHSDHHYFTNKPTCSSKASDCFTNTSSEVYRKIMKEWRVLEKSLPDTIFVRVYEQRVDLLRAVIMGPAGTPYHDGLFFFDIMFPSDYPNKPPSVSYHSFGMRINPNLYANGYVCLSLLNTWHGKKKEKWDPQNSTVLQILVSIQGLVLNCAPYFNEPGANTVLGGGRDNRVKKSNAYTENCFILSCKTMVYLLRKPPKNFEDLINWHFRRRARDILVACNSYLNEKARVGFYPGISCDNVEISKVFKTAIKAWYPQMVTAFKRAGVAIGDDVASLVEERKTVSLKDVEKKVKKTVSLKDVEKKVKKTVSFKGVIMKIRKILGLKKVGVAQEV